MAFHTIEPRSEDPVVRILEEGGKAGGFLYQKNQDGSITHSDVYAFILGREWKLSLAELITIFGERNLDLANEKIAIFHLEKFSPRNFPFASLGGTIRMIEIWEQSSHEKFHEDIIRFIQGEAKDSKYTFALGQYGTNFPLFTMGIRMKKVLHTLGINARIANKDNTNLHAASFKKEGLVRSGGEWNFLDIEGVGYIGKTLACQDIDDYTRRDTAKSRDMEVGMMPPKLVQMMIHLALGKKDISMKDVAIYDPFCGLGTTLIEAANMGITKVMGSDASSRMVESTEKNLGEFIKTELVWQERIRTAGGTPAKDFQHFEKDVFELNAIKVGERLQAQQVQGYSIVSEGYLGEVMMKDSITLDRVKIERQKLAKMYDAFFSGLRSLDFNGSIVMTFPFWDVRGTNSFFIEIHDVLARHNFEVVPILPRTMKGLLTAKGTLLYKRPGQNVGREVTKIQLKK